MSWWVKEINTISEDESERLCVIETDTPNDLPNPVRTKPDPDNPGQTITDYTIVRGSEAYCLSNSKTYKLNSQGQWIEQTTGGGGGGASSADQVSYDNTDSGMTATNVQDAIDELKDTNDTQDGEIADLQSADTNLQSQINSLSTVVDTKTTVAAIYGLPPTTIAPPDGSTESLNDYTTPGVYTVPTATAAGRITDSPVTTRGYRLEVKQYRSGSYYRQTIMPWGEANVIYTRSRQGGTNWTAWYKFEATQVQTVQSLNSPLMLNREEITPMNLDEVVPEFNEETEETE